MRQVLQMLLVLGVLIGVSRTTALADDAAYILEWDVGYLSPIGAEFGLAWGPHDNIESYGQIGVIGFNSKSGYDDTASEFLNLGPFFTYSLGIRLRAVRDDDRRRWAYKYFLGVAFRDFSGLGSGDALDCLECSDWERRASYPFNTYVTAGVRLGKILLSAEYRLTDRRGHGYWRGYDPYHVGATWFESWDDMSSPRAIIQIAYGGLVDLGH